MVCQLILSLKHKDYQYSRHPNQDDDKDERNDDEDRLHHDSVLHSLAAGYDHKNTWDSLMFCQLLSPMRPDIANSAVFSP